MPFSKTFMFRVATRAIPRRPATRFSLPVIRTYAKEARPWDEFMSPASEEATDFPPQTNELAPPLPETYALSDDLPPRADEGIDSPDERLAAEKLAVHGIEAGAVSKSGAGKVTFTPKELIWHLHCKSTGNNTTCAVADPDGKVLGTWSGGCVGFKKSQRASYEAGYQCAIRAFDLTHLYMEEHVENRVAIHFKGFGQGREAFKSAILTMEGEKIRHRIVAFSDHTPLKIGGTRAKKARRI